MEGDMPMVLIRWNLEKKNVKMFSAQDYNIIDSNMQKIIINIKIRN